MDVPPGFIHKSWTNKVCWLRKSLFFFYQKQTIVLIEKKHEKENHSMGSRKKSLYGLKQSLRTWFGRFTKSMVQKGYHQSQGDHTLFFKHSPLGMVTILIVYVDDIIITGHNLEEIRKLQSYLAKEFKIKDLGSLRYFLGIEVARSKMGFLFLNENMYKIYSKKLACQGANLLIPLQSQTISQGKIMKNLWLTEASTKEQ